MNLSMRTYINVAIAAALIGAIMYFGFGFGNAASYDDGCDGAYAYMQDLNEEASQQYWYNASYTDKAATDGLEWTNTYVTENEPPEPIKGYFAAYAKATSGGEDMTVYDLLAVTEDFEREEAKIQQQCSGHPLVTEFFS